MYISIYPYIYISIYKYKRTYIYTHTHTHTHTILYTGQSREGLMKRPHVMSHHHIMSHVMSHHHLMWADEEASCCSSGCFSFRGTEAKMKSAKGGKKHKKKKEMSPFLKKNKKKKETSWPNVFGAW